MLIQKSLLLHSYNKKIIIFLESRNTKKFWLVNAQFINKKYELELAKEKS